MNPGKVCIRDANGEEKMVGIYNAGERLFTAVRWPSKHKMVFRNEWGIDARVLEGLIEDRARVRIRDMEAGKEYWADAEKVKAEGRLKSYGKHGKQYFMELDKWELRAR